MIVLLDIDWYNVDNKSRKWGRLNGAYLYK